MKGDKKSIPGMKVLLTKLVPVFEIGVLALLFFSLIGSISRTKNVVLKIEKEKQQVEELKKEREKIIKDIEIAQSQDFVEKQLRDKLSMAKEGEIVVILPDAEEVKKFAPRIDEEEEILPEPNWKKWLNLFM